MEIKKILLYFFSWRILLIAPIIIAPYFFKLQDNFLGGGVDNYLTNPYLWSWANFDGEHYIAIAREGYRPLTYFFFPMYPMLIKSLATMLGNNFNDYLYAGLLISNISLIIGLIGFLKLLRIDFDAKAPWLTVLILLIFPTSFYLGAVFTESLFLALSVWSIYLFKKQEYFLSGILAALSSATRVFGVALIIYFAIETYFHFRKTKKLDFGKLMPIIILPLGILGYMYYLYSTTGDALAFFHNISIFGDQRSTNLILFPQVFYRYLFKIIPALNFHYFPVVFTTFLELFTSILCLATITWLFIIKKHSYAFYSLALYAIATLSGSFSSFPRYALSIFPMFIVLSLWMSRLPQNIKVIFYLTSVLLLVVSTMLFASGYWVS